MIGHIEGRVLSKGERHAVIDVRGLGYKVFLPASALKQAVVDESMQLWTHLHVREDAMELYGFSHQAELELFENLIAISGIGPKSALGVLALASVDTLKRAIAAGDTSYLTKVSGVGRKTAEKIVLELKEKMGYEKASYSGAELQHDADVLDALISLGYSQGQAREALSKISPKISGREARLKEALKLLGK